MERRVDTLAPTPATRTAHRHQAVAKVLLWASAAITMAILFALIGYTVYRGMVSDNPREYPVIGAGATEIPIGTPGGEALSVLVNRGLAIRDLSVEDLQALLSGETTNWGALSGQDVETEVFFPLGTMTRDAERPLLGASREWAAGAMLLPDPASVMERVAATQGGIGLVPAAFLRGRADVDAKAVPVRLLSIVASPEVLALSLGRQLSFLNEETLRAVFSGKVASWKEIGGPDLPVRVVVLSPARWERQHFSRLVFSGSWSPPAGAVTVATPEGLRERVSETPGAVGFCSFLDSPRNVLSVERREVRRNLTLSYIMEAPRRAGRVGGISTIILNTVIMIFLTLLFTTPIGVAAAIYLTEYARQGRLIRILRFGTETLAGIPSILFGLFGFIAFVTYLRLGIGLLSGTLTVTMMVLPTIIRTAEEAIKAVPVAMREGSLSLGATKLQTTFRIVVPAASPGILSGVILAIGRAAGETAALLFTLGTDYRLVEGFTSSARVLAVHLFFLVKEGLSTDKGFATATVLVLVILIVNSTTTRLIGRINVMRVEGSGK